MSTNTFNSSSFHSSTLPGLDETRQSSQLTGSTPLLDTGDAQGLRLSDRSSATPIDDSNPLATDRDFTFSDPLAIVQIISPDLDETAIAQTHEIIPDLATGTYDIQVQPTLADNSTQSAMAISSNANFAIGYGDWFSANLYTQNIADLARTLDRDGSLSRTDMITIFRKAESGGVVDTYELHDLQVIVSNATGLNMPDYVQVLSNKIVNGSLANAKSQGVAVGNLYAGSSAHQLEVLLGEHFFGMDHPNSVIPATTTHSTEYITYGYASGSLFGTDGAPQLTDIRQGALGDCYFLASLGAVVTQNPNTIGNMFLDNGDGTFTVRLFKEQNGTVGSADYVTVDRWLPIDVSTAQSMGQQLAGYDSLNQGLWVALAEKAFAQFSEEGLNQRPASGTTTSFANSYGSIEGGLGVRTMPSITGHNSTIYATDSSYATVGNYGGGLLSLSQIATALNNGLALTAGTNNNGQRIDSRTGIVQSHEYVIVGTDLVSGTITLYNPWGDTDPTSTGDLRGYKVIDYNVFVSYDLSEISVSYA